MATGDEGVLTLSIGVRISPEPAALELLHRYRDALNYAINSMYNALRVWGLMPRMGTPLTCPQPNDLGDRSINPPPEG